MSKDRKTGVVIADLRCHDDECFDQNANVVEVERTTEIQGMPGYGTNIKVSMCDRCGSTWVISKC